jgi:hypothetical protein
MRYWLYDSCEMMNEIWIYTRRPKSQHITTVTNENQMIGMWFDNLQQYRRQLRLIDFFRFEKRYTINESVWECVIVYEKRSEEGACEILTNIDTLKNHQSVNENGNIKVLGIRPILQNLQSDLQNSEKIVLEYFTLSLQPYSPPQQHQSRVFSSFFVYGVCVCV